MNEEFTLVDEYIALCDLLKVCGVATSGGTAKLMISQGHVDVNGVTELRKTCKIYGGSKVSGFDFTIDVISATP